MNDKSHLFYDKNFETIVSRFKNGEVGLLPTDTLYGICARIDDEEAIKRVFEIKRRERNKPFLVLADSLAQVMPYLAPLHREDIHSIITRYWPGPLTIILPCRRDRVPDAVRAGGDSLAVRVPDHPLLRQAIRAVGAPLIAPSANKSGETPPGWIDEIDPEVVEAVDFIVEGECTMKIASTILDCSVNPCRVVRAGAVSIEP